MEENVNQINKKGIFLGLAFSFMIFISSFLFTIFATTLLNSIVITSNGFHFPFIPPEPGTFLNSPAMLFITKYIILVMLLVFLFFNTVAIVISKNKSKKRGLLIGYFIPIFIAVITSL